MVLDGDGAGTRYVWREPYISTRKDLNNMSIADQFIELRKRAVSDDDRYNDKPKECWNNGSLILTSDYHVGGLEARELTVIGGGTSLKSESLKARTKKDFGQVDTEYLGRLLDEIRKQAEKIRPNKKKLSNLCNKLDKEAKAIVLESIETNKAFEKEIEVTRMLSKEIDRHIKEKNQLGSKKALYKAEIKLLNAQKAELKHKLRCFEEDEQGLKVRNIMRNAMGKVNERI